MEEDKKRVCQYGAKCYRKNKNHLKDFFHPPVISSDKSKEDAEVVDNSSKVKAKRHETNEGLKGQCPSESPVRKKRRSTESGNNPVFSKEETKVQTKLKLDEGKEQQGSENKEEKNNVDCSEKENEENHSDNYVDEDGGNASEGEDDVKSNSWTYIKAPEKVEILDDSELKNEEWKQMSKEDKIKFFFLVDMPPDFYSFFEFCESINHDEPTNALKAFQLKLVGPYDILAGSEIKFKNKEQALCHWRYFYDPPEFQTVLAAKSGFHIGYWRDSPEDLPVFVASNNPNEDCVFKIEGENIFAAAYHYLTTLAKTSDPFTKVKASKLQTDLNKWAEKNKYLMEKKTPQIKARERKVNSKTFHKAGIVVPVEKKTDVGYRPLIETEANIKKICNLIMDASSSEEREILMDKLHPLITAAAIANDECDFGNSLELGIDLFCMGSPIFHDMVSHLLSTAYSLLNRSQFGDIIEAHLKNRRKTIDFESD